MKAKKLVEIIEPTAEIYVLAGNQVLADQMKDLESALKGQAGLEVAFILEVIAAEPTGTSDPLCEHLRALALLHQKSGAKKIANEFVALSIAGERLSLASQIRKLDLVSFFSNKLAAAEQTLPAIQAILKSMSAPGVLGSKEAIVVAKSYVGGPGSFKNKKAAFEAIRDRVARNVGLESKSRMS